MDYFYDLNFYGSFTIKKSVQNIFQKIIYYCISYGMGMQTGSWKATVQLQAQSNTSELIIVCRATWKLQVCWSSL